MYEKSALSCRCVLVLDLCSVFYMHCFQTLQNVTTCQSHRNHIILKPFCDITKQICDSAFELLTCEHKMAYHNAFQNQRRIHGAMLSIVLVTTWRGVSASYNLLSFHSEFVHATALFILFLYGSWCGFTSRTVWYNNVMTFGIHKRPMTTVDSLMRMQQRATVKHNWRHNRRSSSYFRETACFHVFVVPKWQK